MDQDTLVDMQIQDGRRLLERLSGEDFPVTAAGWLKESEGGPWLFYLVTPLVGEDGVKRPTYLRLGAVLRRMPQPFWVDPMEITVVAPDSALGKAIRDIATRRPGPVPMPYGSTRLGGLSVDGAFIYPPAAATSGKAEYA